jgi:hypothetical protein
MRVGLAAAQWTTPLLPPSGLGFQSGAMVLSAGSQVLIHSHCE